MRDKFHVDRTMEIDRSLFWSMTGTIAGNYDFINSECAMQSLTPSCIWSLLCVQSANMLAAPCNSIIILTCCCFLTCLMFCLHFELFIGHLIDRNMKILNKNEKHTKISSDQLACVRNESYDRWCISLWIIFIISLSVTK